MTKNVIGQTRTSSMSLQEGAKVRSEEAIPLHSLNIYGRNDDKNYQVLE